MNRPLHAPGLPARPASLDGHAPARPRSTARLRTALLLALACAWLAATGWARPLTLPDEGRYVGIALEMLQSGHWSVPTLDGLPFFHKPPLFYWITAGAMSLLGVTEWAARAASLLGACAGAAALYLLVRRWAGARPALCALGVLLTQPLWFVGAQFANMDMLVAGCITATIALAAHAALQREQGLRWRAPLLGACACAALGVLAKGLIGAVLPALVIGAWLVLRGRWRDLPALLWPPALLLFAALAAPWFVAMQWEHPGFFHYFIVVQHLQRFASGGFNNVQPVWFYAAVLGLLALPWSAWPLLKLRAWVRDASWQRLRQQPLPLLMVVWGVVVVGFFSLPDSKLVGYVLPAAPPAAFLMARLVAASRRRVRLAATALAVLACLGAVAGFTLHPPGSNREAARLLAAQRAPGEPVVFVQDYYYDLGFYTGTDLAPRVADRWHDPEVQGRDNWRKELADAGTFAPERAAARLLEESSLAQHLCEAPVSWVVGHPDVLQRHAFLARARAQPAGEDIVLWRVDSRQPAMARSLGCR